MEALKTTHPEPALIIKSIEQLHDVLMVTRRQNVNLHHVVFQLLLCLRVNDLGCSQDPRLSVLSL